MNVTNQTLLPAKNLTAAEVERIAKSMGPQAAGSEITVGEDGSVATVSKSREENDRDSNASSAAHGTYAWRQAGDAIGAITKQISGVDRAIALQRPKLNGTDWDFAMKDGKFVVTGSGLTKDDTKFIEDKLNGNHALVSAANSFVNAAIKNLQITDDYQGGTTNKMYGGGLRELAFDHVAERLNGAINFKHFLAKNEDLATAQGQLKIEDFDRGYSALNLLGSRLDSNVKAVGYSVFPTAR